LCKNSGKNLAHLIVALIRETVVVIEISMALTWPFSFKEG
jgi:hypothetical protein